MPNLYINTQAADSSQALIRGITTPQQPVELPDIVVGDKELWKVWFTNGFAVESWSGATDHTLKLAIGRPNQLPSSGEWVLMFGSEKTELMPVNATAAQVQKSLENLSTIGAGNVKVNGGPGGYHVEFVGGKENTNVGEITGDVTELYPMATLAITVEQEGSGSQNEEVWIEIREQPYVLLQTWAQGSDYWEASLPTNTRGLLAYLRSEAVGDGLVLEIEVTKPGGNTITYLQSPVNVRSDLINTSAIETLDLPGGGGGGTDDQVASEVPNTPAGDISATNVQDAINELDAEKASTASLASHTSNTSNPHSVTKAQVGLTNVDNTSDVNKPVSTAQQTALDAKANSADVLKRDNTTSYTPTTDYHPATKKYVDDSGGGGGTDDQVASEVPNTPAGDISATNVQDAINELDAEKASTASLASHTSNTSNPHSVTKAQVGLGNVDNTSDTGKPVSTAQQTALDAKANISNVLTKDNTTAFTPDADYEPATKKYVDDSGGHSPGDDIEVGRLNFSNATVLPILNGSVTRTQSLHIVAAETGTSDSIDSIAGGVEGDIIIFAPDAGDTITFNDGTSGGDNLDFAGQNVVLDSVNERLGVIYNGTNWVILFVSPNLIGIGADTITTTELNDGEDSPVTGEFVRVDGSDTEKLQYSSVSEVKAALSLNNVDNTSDANKPVSTAQQTALDAKADASSLTSHTGNTSNPHSVTKAQVGLGNVDNTSDVNKPVSTAQQTALDAKADASSLTSHTSNTSNPHSVTKAQVGLGNADNTSDANKPVSTAQQTALDAKADSSSLTSHTSNTSNPHSVTKAQVGLTNVDNTSDANKPVSTAQQTALDAKVAKVGFPVEIGLALSDESTDLTTGTAKVTLRAPYAFTLTGVRINVNTAPTGSALMVDVNEGGVSVFSTVVSIDAGEKTSATAATAAVISDGAIADDAELTFDIDQVGSTIPGKGLKVWLIGWRDL